MKLTRIFLAVLLAAMPMMACATEQPELNCALGPTTISLGGNDWLVYGCDDGRSVVIVAAPPNPASPFVFIVSPTSEGGITAHGEGTGAQSATRPAYEELQAMSAADVAQLHQQANSAAGQ
jgi:hypothetical protein